MMYGPLANEISYSISNATFCFYITDTMKGMEKIAISPLDTSVILFTRSQKHLDFVRNARFSNKADCTRDNGNIYI